MAAGPANRQRKLALAIVLLLVAGSFLALVPPVAAQASLTAPDVHIFVDGARVPTGSPAALSIGETFEVYAFTNVSTNNCHIADRGEPSVAIWAEMENFSSAYNASQPLTIQDVTELSQNLYHVQAHGAFTVGSAMASKNGATLAINATALTSCQVGTVPAEQTAVSPRGSSQEKVLLDNAAPVLGVTVSSAGSGAIGDTYTVTISGRPSDLSTIQIDLTEFDTSLTNASRAQNTVPATITGLIQQTGVDAPDLWIKAVDTRGNAWDVSLPTSFDARRPLAGSMPVVSPQQFNGDANAGDVAVQVPLPAGDDDIVGYNVAITRDQQQILLKCPDQVECAGFVDTFTLDRSALGLSADTAYSLKLNARDEKGNVGPDYVVANFVTAPLLTGEVRLELVSGTGGIGSMVRATPHATSDNVTSVTLDLTPVGGDSSAAVPDTGLEFELKEGQSNAAALQATLRHVNGTTWPATMAGAAGGAPPTFDVKRPGPVTSPQVNARPGGHVVLTFGAPASGDAVYNYTVVVKKEGTTTEHRVTFAQIGTEGPYNFSQLTPPFSFDLGSRYSFDIIAYDPAGNDGARTPGDGSLSTIPDVNPSNINIHSLPSTIREIPVFTGTFVSPETLQDGQTYVRVYLERNGLYWDGSMFQSQKHLFDATHDASTSTWSYGGFTALTDGAGSEISSGDYSFGVEFDVSPADDSEIDFVLDRVAPDIDAISYPASPASGIGQGDTLRVRVQAEDDVSAITNVTLSIVTPTEPHTLVSRLGGGHATRTCPAECAPQTVLPTNLLDATFTIPLTRIPMGTYAIQVTVEDAAGRTTTTTYTSQLIKVLPRVRIDLATDSPTAFSDGIQVRAYAAYDALNTSVPEMSCTDPSIGYACRVASVELRARTRGSASPDVHIANTTLPFEGPKTFSFLDDGLLFYNYTTPGRIDVTEFNGNLDPRNLEVKAIAWVRTPTNQWVNHTTAWYRVQADHGAAQLNINKPSQDWEVNMSGAAGELKFNVTLEQPGLEGQIPTINYSIRALNGTQYYNVHDAGASQPTGYFSAEPEVDYTLRDGAYVPPAGSLFNWSWTSEASLPRGVYLLNVTADIPGTNAKTVSAHRIFVVEDRSPTVAYNLTGSQVYRERHAATPFDLSVHVQHGYANLSAAQVRAILEENGGQTYESGQTGGFVANPVVFRQLAGTDLHNRTTEILYSVTMPSSAVDGSRYALRLRLTTDAYALCSCPTANGTAFQDIIVDAQAPRNVAALRAQTNATGRDIDAPLHILGTAEDVGAGIKRVEVKLRNLTGGSTFMWNVAGNGSFVTGDRDAWMSSDLLSPGSDSLPKVRNVVLSYNSSANFATWSIPASGRPMLDDNGARTGAYFRDIPLDRYSLYEVTVRVTDNVSKVTTFGPVTVRFDPDAPYLHDAAASIGGLHGPKVVPYRATPLHQQAPVHQVFTTNVSDNHCVKNVWLRALAPSGAVYSAPFNGSADSAVGTRPAAAVCDKAAGTGTAKVNWSISLKDHPHMVSEVGQTTFWVEAEDYAGRNVSVPAANRTFVVKVTDTLPAWVQARSFDPPVAQTGGSSQLRANIIENQGIDRIDVYGTRIEGTQNVGETVGPFKMRPHPTLTPAANGTGVWIIDTADDMNLSLELGTYRFQIRPIDVEGTGCEASQCAMSPGVVNVLLEVVADAAPSVKRTSPAEGTEYVNATPTFVYRVVDPGVLRTDITASAGEDNDSLVALTPDITGDNRTGYTVTFKPNVTAGQENLTVRVSAKDGSFTTSVVDTFPVDSVGPDVSVNMTGNVTGADGRDYAVDATRIVVNATDALSGVAGLTISESVNNGTASTRSATLGQPFAVGEGDGFHRLTYTVRDNASNAESGSLEFYVDATGPAISLSGESNGLEIVVSVVDRTGSVNGVGLNASTLALHYKYAGETLYSNASFVPVTGNLYKVALPRNASEEGLSYYVEALDLLGNRGTLGTADDPELIEVDDGGEGGDRAPVLTITSPSDGTTVTGETLRVEYTATDADGDVINITVALRDANGERELLVTSGENTGFYLLDATARAAGDYTLVITATAGTQDGQDEVAFRIGSDTPDAPPVRLVSAPPTSAAIGTEIAFTVDLSGSGKQIMRATFTVMRDGAVVGSGNLVGLATGYRGTYTPTSAGSYEVLVSAQFTDGTSLGATPAATFTVADAGVEPAPAASFPASLMLLLVMGALTVGLAAYAAFVRWKQ